ncbi:MAG: hypothetical protein ACREBZ_02545 [Thermoplasmata archaeon]
MQAGTKELPGDEHATKPEPKGHRLRPLSVEVIREVLTQGYEHSPQFVEHWFSIIAQRGAVTYSDVEEMTDDQADALRYEMARNYRYFLRQDGILRGKTEGRLLGEPNAEPTHHAVKAKQYAEALKDLCRVFEFEFPLGS